MPIVRSIIEDNFVMDLFQFFERREVLGIKGISFVLRTALFELSMLERDMQRNILGRC